jgi:hypothetical protein
MDIIFANRISAGIFRQCAEKIVADGQYSESPIELRKRITDCIDVYADQHQMVLDGMKKAEVVMGVTKP